MKSSRDIRNLIAARSENIINLFTDVGFTISRAEFERRFQEIADHEEQLRLKRIEKRALYYKANREYLLQKAAAYREANREEINAWCRNDYHQRKSHHAARNKACYERHREARIAHQIAYNNAHREQIKARQRYMAEMRKAYITRYKDQIKAFREEYDKLHAQEAQETDAVG